MISAFRKLITDDQTLNRVQDMIAQMVSSLISDPLLSRQIISVSLASGSNVVSHNLKRQPKGWLISDRNSAATIYRTAWDSASITLQLSAPLAGTLEVY
jgi:hypothetical protein